MARDGSRLHGEIGELVGVRQFMDVGIGQQHGAADTNASMSAGRQPARRFLHNRLPSCAISVTAPRVALALLISARCIREAALFVGFRYFLKDDQHLELRPDEGTLSLRSLRRPILIMPSFRQYRLSVGGFPLGPVVDVQIVRPAPRWSGDRGGMPSLATAPPAPCGEADACRPSRPSTSSP